MKKHGIALFFILFSWVTYAQKNDENTWVKYPNTVLIDIKSAQKIKEFENTPASLVTYFYASRIRKDRKWKKVLPKEKLWSRRLVSALREYKNWTFTKFRLVSKKEHSSGKIWLKIWIEIEYKGCKDSGTDEVSLELIDGKWVIVDLPT